jgi:hypothetical protein
MSPQYFTLTSSDEAMPFLQGLKGGETEVSKCEGLCSNQYT